MAQNESLLYVVDFEENMGSAVLAADDRIYTPILAVTESGSLLTSVDKIPYIQGENYDEADLTNFSLYNANEDDYYVGIADNFALEVCEKYATSQVLQSSDETSYSNSSSNTTYTGPDFGNWIITEKISPKLTTVWHQSSPFNDATPIKKGQHSPAGCVAVAVAQIVAYHEYPHNLTVNGYNINWTKLKDICNRNSPYDSQSSVSSYYYDRQALAQLISTIGIGCGMWYAKNWSFALPKNARNFMRDFLGYTNVVRHYDWNDFESNIVYNMLKNDNPVFIAAVSGLANGHAWVIDGFIQREREILSPTIKAFASTFWGRFLYQNGKQNERLFHCNFGWKGANANGYYYSGMFNKDGSREDAGEIYDDPNAGNNINYNFDWLYHIITYNHPN